MYCRANTYDTNVAREQATQANDNTQQILRNQREILENQEKLLKLFNKLSADVDLLKKEILPQPLTKKTTGLGS